MRISDASASAPLYPSAAVSSESDATNGFPEVLKGLLTNAAPIAPTLLTTNLHIHLELHQNQEQRQEQLLVEKNQSHAELHEEREDEYIENLLENQEEMEDLIDHWEENGERKEIKSEKEQPVEEAQKEEEPAHELEETTELLHLQDDLQQDKHNNEGPSTLIEKKQAAPSSTVSEAIMERDLTYQEIQMLMETTLQSKNRLQRRVREVLQALLESLAQGQRFLLDQHRLAGLETHEWMEITQLFPPRFYGGLVRQAMLINGTLGVNQLHDKLNHLQQQIPPTTSDQLFWRSLWEPVLGDWPLAINNWWSNQPLLAESEALKHILGILHQRNALPTGAIGQTLSLALAHQHSPESLDALFAITQKWLHFQALHPDEIHFFSEKVYERCYTQDLSDRGQIMTYLQNLLNGQSLEENALIQVLQGCTQNVLSYLPSRYLPSEIRELQDYVRNDLFGKEEAVLQLLTDADHPRQG